MHRFILLLVLLTLGSFVVKAQHPDTVVTGKDTVDKVKRPASPAPIVPKTKSKRERIYAPDSTHNPREIMFHSAMVPGWGQLDNKHWWKLPIIYGGFVGTGLIFEFNNRYYTEFLKEAGLREQGEPGNPAYAGASNDAIIQVKDYYRRNRDLSILGFIGVWGIQMIDAYVQAKFIHSYTMDDDLTFKISPGLISQPAIAGNYGFSYLPVLKIAFTVK